MSNGCVLNESVNDGAVVQTGHCQPIFREKLYPDQCPDAKRVHNPGKPAPVINGTITDSTFGTDDNVDSCQQGLQSVLDVYTDGCPDGGTPVRKFAQCGGVDYSGPTCCYGYSVCVKVPLLTQSES